MLTFNTFTSLIVFRMQCATQHSLFYIPYGIVFVSQQYMRVCRYLAVCQSVCPSVFFIYLSIPVCALSLQTIWEPQRQEDVE